MQTDVRLVEAAQAGDAGAFAALYDRHAAAVHAFCHGRLGDEHAGDALRTTFVRAGGRLDRLDDPAAFRPWILALARTTVAELADERGVVDVRMSWGPVVGRRSPSRAPDGSEPRSRPTPEETAALVVETATALSRRDQELLGLHVREGLDGTDLAVAMGVDPRDVDAMVEQLKDRLSASVGPLLIARSGLGTCDELDDLLADWNGTYSRGIRSRVSRHVDGCDRCRRTRDTAIAWPSIGTAMSTPPPPPDVRAAVLDAFARDSGSDGDHEAATPAPVVDPTITSDDPPAELATPPDERSPDPDVTAGGRRRFRANPAATVVVALLVAGTTLIGLSAVGGDRDDRAGAEGVDGTETSSSTPSPTRPIPTTTATPTTTRPPTTTTAAPTTTRPPTTVDALIGPLFFGSTAPVAPPDEGSTITYTFANVGDAPMTWTASISTPFTVDATAGTTASGEQVTLTIGREPTAGADDVDGTLVVGTDGGRFTIALRSAPPPPA